MEGGEMSRYVIEIKPEYEDKIRGVMILGAENSNLYLDSMAVDELETLNSDYIKEHFGDLQDTAYKRGVNDGSIDVKERVDCAYQRGLDDAWEAAKKIALMDTETSENVTGYFGLFRIMENLTPMQAIEKLKAYEEQKADDEIKVGDEVISLKANGEVIEDMSPLIVTYETKYSYQGFDAGGIFHNNPKERVRKTGRHFDIEAILKEMANEDNRGLHQSQCCEDYRQTCRE